MATDVGTGCKAIKMILESLCITIMENILIIVFYQSTKNEIPNLALVFQLYAKKFSKHIAAERMPSSRTHHEIASISASESAPGTIVSGMRS